MESVSDERRDRSSSSNSHAAHPKSGTIRLRPAPRSSTSSFKQSRERSTSDEQSLTSFPSLSPSLAASPESTFRYLPSKSSSKLQDDDSFTKPKKTPSTTTLDDLFSPASDAQGRSALFQDSPKHVKDVPGTLHHQSDEHVQHLVARVGAVTLVKQLAHDLAQRDAHVSDLQRKAEEREGLLKRMLRDCKMSNMEIEKRFKELESERKQTRSEQDNTAENGTSANVAKSSPSIDDQMSEAFDDVVGDVEAQGGAAVTTSRTTSVGNEIKNVSRRSSKDQQLAGPDQDKTVRRNGMATGWKSVFGLQGNTAKPPRTTRSPMLRHDSAQERLSAIHTASQNNLRRKGLTADLFQPPLPEDVGEQDRQTHSDHGGILTKTDSNDAASTKSGLSVSSWAMKLVGGKQNASSDRLYETRKGRASTLNQLKSDEREVEAPLARAKSGAAVNSSHQSSSASSKSRPRPLAPNGTVRRIPAETVRQSDSTLSNASGPEDTRAPNSDGPGPMEMDTILPDSIRPPTQLPYENGEDSAGYLTDRFGFIYDQRRKSRQSQPISTISRSNKNSRIETLENHRKSVNSLKVGDDDAASHKSRLSADLRPGSPASLVTAVDAQPPKRWQDYLNIAGPRTELLSHTPSAAPITNIVTAEPSIGVPSKARQITISKRGSVLALGSNPAPSPTRAVSQNAELATPAKSGASTPTSPTDAQSDPVRSLLDQLTEVHDALQRDKTTKWNEFLRKIRAERKRTGEASSNDRRSKAVMAPEASLLDGEVIGISGLGNEGKVGRAKWIEFKNLVLGGIPVAYRAKIWAECSGASEQRIPGYYEELVATEADDQIVKQQIQMDIPRTLTDNIFFRKGQGMQKLSEILLAYARRNTEIGYCQGMNLIAANLLLIMPSAEDAFWVLVTMIENILPDKYYDHSLLTSRADQSVLRQYVTTLFPQLSAHLDALSIELEALTFQWFLSVFTDCLSAEALFRVWDVVLCTQDGATFLFQVALALLKLNEKPLLACEGPAEIYAYINQRMTDHAISIDGLIKASEGLKKVVKREDIINRRAVVVEQEQETTRLREAIRKDKSKALDPEGPASEGHENPDHDMSKPSLDNTKQQKTMQGGEDNVPYGAELEYRQPMPVDEEIEWRA